MWNEWKTKIQLCNAHTHTVKNVNQIDPSTHSLTHIHCSNATPHSHHTHTHIYARKIYKECVTANTSIAYWESVEFQKIENIMWERDNINHWEQESLCASEKNSTRTMQQQIQSKENCIYRQTNPKKLFVPFVEQFSPPNFKQPTSNPIYSIHIQKTIVHRLWPELDIANLGLGNSNA